jgi:drug/metabolite transporter (DMT)-like permease
VTLLVGEYVPPGYENFLVKPQLFEALHFLQRQPDVMYDMFAFGFLGAAGQCFIFLTIGSFGSLTVVAITTTRKILSLFISITVHGHALSEMQWAATAVIVAGVAVETYINVTKKKSKPKTQ